MSYHNQQPAPVVGVPPPQGYSKQQQQGYPPPQSAPQYGGSAPQGKYSSNPGCLEGCFTVLCYFCILDQCIPGCLEGCFTALCCCCILS